MNLKKLQTIYIKYLLLWYLFNTKKNYNKLLSEEQNNDKDPLSELCKIIDELLSKTNTTENLIEIIKNCKNYFYRFLIQVIEQTEKGNI